MSMKNVPGEFSARIPPQEGRPADSESGQMLSAIGPEEFRPPPSRVCLTPPHGRPSLASLL